MHHIVINRDPAACDVVNSAFMMSATQMLLLAQLLTGSPQPQSKPVAQPPRWRVTNGPFSLFRAEIYRNPLRIPDPARGRMIFGEIVRPLCVSLPELNSKSRLEIDWSIRVGILVWPSTLEDVTQQLIYRCMPLVGDFPLRERESPSGSPDDE
jgi:hypothetical protein